MKPFICIYYAFIKGKLRRQLRGVYQFPLMSFNAQIVAFCLS